MQSIKIALAFAIVVALGANLSSAAELKAVQPKPAVGGFTAAPGTGVKATTYWCCSTVSGQCTQHSLTAVCVGSNYIRIVCPDGGKCYAEPIGGDN